VLIREARARDDGCSILLSGSRFAQSFPALASVGPCSVMCARVHASALQCGPLVTLLVTLGGARVHHEDLRGVAAHGWQRAWIQRRLWLVRSTSWHPVRAGHALPSALPILTARSTRPHCGSARRRVLPFASSPGGARLARGSRCRGSPTRARREDQKRIVTRPEDSA
jgi:hypothetical protein